jgi:hypothetical protein
MIDTRSRNFAMIVQVAKRLGDFREKVVFLGGCAALSRERFSCFFSTLLVSLFF